MNIGFTHPMVLWLLLALLPLALLFIWAEKKRSVQIQKFASARLNTILAKNVSTFRRILRFILAWLALALAIIAMAGPHAGYHIREIKVIGRDILIAIDTSRSMLANDLQPNRLTRAKLASEDLIRMLPGDRIGIIAFAGSAFVQAPLTIDHGAVTDALRALDTEIIPRGGTDLSAPMNIAIEAFGKGEGHNKALILFTDGEDLAQDGNFNSMIEKTLQAGIRVFAIGIGSPSGSTIPMQLPDGSTEFVRDPNGEIVHSKLDESALLQLSDATNGAYFAFSSTLDPAAAIHQLLSSIDNEEMQSEQVRQPIVRYSWPLTAAIILLILHCLISERRGGHSWFRRFHASSNTANGLKIFLSSLFCFAFLHSSRANEKEALAQYDQGDPQSALEAFQDLDSQKFNDRQWYNFGTIASQAGNFDEAILAFGQALESGNPTIQQNTAYNLGTSLIQKTLQSEDSVPVENKITDVKDAIKHFEYVLNQNADAENAQKNLQAAKELLKYLEEQKQQQDQQQQDQQQQDQQQQDQQQQDQQQQDQQQQDQQQQDQQQQDQQQQDQQQQDQQQQDQQQQDQHQQDQQQQDQQQQDQQQQDQQQQDQQQQDQPENAEEQSAVPISPEEGQLTEEEAKRLLESMRDTEAKVLLFDEPRRRNDRNIKNW